MKNGAGKTIQDPHGLPERLPGPADDGAADHLPGKPVPHVVLPSSIGDIALGDLAAERLILYAYPQTGRPDKPIPAGWDELPGARGCTAQSCGFRDHAAELATFGARVAGVSSQSRAEQQEFAARTQMPFPIISDEQFVLAATLALPTFEFDGARYYRRLALIAEEGVVVKVFYPAFPPDRNAADVFDWLSRHRAAARSAAATGNNPPGR